ncbi:hypothetical protein [Schlesneria paludicola]|uniref:hypothetical protein n=1 Tax=Schlesneria paludicola TaxID=360056 RepID=UPI0012FAF284|nr:hypothetical protein [Schlesneria paludicola]
MLRLLAAGFLGLIASTWPLWTPQSAFPEVPLFRVAGRLHAAVDWAFLYVLLAAQGSLLVAPRIRYRRVVTLISMGCTLGLVCIDQHRLQPWAWQFILVSLVLSAADASTARRAWRWIVIGIYVWSAWSKLDYGFTQQHGPFLLDGLLKSIGLKTGIQSWSAAARSIISAAIPCAELSIAVSLAWPRTRRVAIYGAAIMHLTLLMALGPWGHNHQPGVLLWNVFFLVQNALLFRQSPPATPTETPGALSQPAQSASVWGNRFAWGVVILAMIWPVTEPFGLCDHWPAWAVYAAKPERVTISIDSDEQSRFPAAMERYFGDDIVEHGWTPMRLDRWSLDAVRCPIYPQDRFQVGVALGMAEEFHLSTLRIVIEGPANRWSGKRSTNVYEGLESIRTLADSYRLGAHPRPQLD